MTTLDGVTPYPPEFAERYRALGYWEDRTLGQWFDETCARFSERVALVAHAEQITYRQLAERVERLQVLDELPLSRFGKVMKQALIEQAKALVAQSPSGQNP